MRRPCRVKPMARIYGSDMDIPGVNSLEGCLESCRVRSFATVSEGLLDCVASNGLEAKAGASFW